MLNSETIFDLSNSLPLVAMLVGACVGLYLMVSHRLPTRADRTVGWSDPAKMTLKSKGTRVLLLFFSIFLFALLCGGVSEWVEHIEYKRFLNFGNQPDQVLVISRDGRTATVSSTAMVQDFFKMIDDAPSLTGRSHPVQLIGLHFPKGEEAYLIGKDAYTSNVYWLIRNFGTERTDPCVLKKFNSERFSKWLHDQGFL